jgi:LPS sulfotransferase NodH
LIESKAVKKRNLKELGQCGRYLLQRPSLPTNRFVIFGDGRAGSTLLVNLLNSSGLVHCDGEIFNTSTPVFFPRLYIRARASRCQASAYGFKLLNYQLQDRQKVKDVAGFLTDLHKSGYKLIYLTRRNKLYHALSQISAVERNKFHHRVDDDKFVYQPLRVKVNDLITKMIESEELTYYYTNLIRSIPYHSLVYEDHLEDSAQHQETADQVFSFLGLPSRPVKTNLMKLMPLELADMVENHQEIREAVKVLPKYSHFLEHTKHY